MADLTIDNDTFKVEVAGDATRPALMLSHSLGADLSMWDAQMPALTPHFQVIRYDTRGHGGSGLGMGPVSIARLGRDALAILDALGIERVHWLGLSMGGAVGLWLLANAPERIDRAVLANTAPRFSAPASWNARITSVLASGMADVAAATMDRWFSEDFAARAPEQVAAIRALLDRAAPDGYAACCAALRDMDMRGSLPEIARDVLIVSGRDDPVVPAADTATMVAAIPGARHVELAARHMSGIEAAMGFNTAVVAFLTGKATSRSAGGRARAAARRASAGAAAKPGASKTAPRKATPAKLAPAKRGSASRRSNAARDPLRKAPPKKVSTKRVAAKKATAKVAAKTVAERRRPARKATVKRPGVTKVVAKKRPAKAVRKTVTARRPTPIATARSAVKVATPKVVAKKAKASKAPAKPTKKTASKAPAKKLPAPRRKPAGKPGRPKGRRTP